MDEQSKERRVEELRGALGEIEREKADLLKALAELEEREKATRHEIQEIEHHVESFTIVVDDHDYRTEQKTMSGAAIKALAGKDATYQLFEEVKGGDDRKIGDHDQISIRNGIEFYTVPPATFGFA